MNRKKENGIKYRYFDDKKKEEVMVMNNKNEYVKLIDFIRILKENKEIKRIMGYNFQIWIKFFERGEKKPANFFDNPYLIEYKHMEWLLFTKYFNQSEWPKLYEAINKIEGLIVRTKEMREKMFSARMPQNQKVPSC